MVTYETLTTRAQETVDEILHTPATADWYELIMTYEDSTDLEKMAELANLLPGGEYGKTSIMLYLFYNFEDFMEL